ncbi:glycoside hydrolase [Streptomyces sp. AcH 505]|uniref:C40 family peptidase n=1 Tax=unclassified Streptomyces TaxID=2593676 RepID=UPI000591C50C|nr:C40 family peptidase [Streptomyces sp. NBC_00370]KIF69151.1 glycoside hydrolase [Streptomyces sp. AcH 505]
MRRPLRAHSYRTAAAVVLACALTVTTQQIARADPATLTQVRAQLDTLYHQAEVATDKYNAADEKVAKQKKRIDKLNAQVKTTEAKLSVLNSQAAAVARAQYRGGGLPAEMQFVLDDDPATALDNASLNRKAQQARHSVLAALGTTREDLRHRTDDASDELKDLKATRRTQKDQQQKIEKHIKAAKQLESQLAAKQLQRIAALERQEEADAQAQWVSTGVLKKVGKKGTSAGRKAVAYAAKQIGKPYVWGAEGPSSFDCSGLTSQAWLAAGHPIPRTSEEQWRQLKHIPVDDMRPGDLIIYFADASHVAIYVGDGQIIQAPRPGRWVYESPAASMPILGAVRPDA